MHAKQFMGVVIIVCIMSYSEHAHKHTLHQNGTLLRSKPPSEPRKSGYNIRSYGKAVGTLHCATANKQTYIQTKVIG